MDPDRGSGTVCPSRSAQPLTNEIIDAAIEGFEGHRLHNDQIAR
jgi:hypothetical protein